MSYQAVKRHGGNLNAYYQVQYAKKPIYCGIPTIGHFEKGRTIERVKRPTVSRGLRAGEVRDEQDVVRAVKLFYMVL